MKNLGSRNCVVLAGLTKPRLVWRWFRLTYLRHWLSILHHAEHLKDAGGRTDGQAV